MLKLSTTAKKKTDQKSLVNKINDGVFDDIIKDEVKYFTYTSNIETVYQLMDASGSVLTYADLGYTNDDIKFYRNNFSQSYFLFDFYDNISTIETDININYEKKFFIGIEFFNDENELLDASEIPVLITFNENIYIKGYHLRTTMVNEAFLKVSFFNAKNGVLSYLYRYNNLRYDQRGIKTLLNNNTYIIDNNSVESQIFNSVKLINLYKYD